jgi:hypothetical protein
MRKIRETVTVGSILGCLAFLFVTIAWVLPTDSFAGERGFPQIKGKVASTRQGTKRARTEANQYEQTAASIRPIEDPKGFRRSALMTAVQAHQKDASEMQQVEVEHRTEADTTMGKR